MNPVIEGRSVILDPMSCLMWLAGTYRLQRMSVELESPAA